MFLVRRLNLAFNLLKSEALYKHFSQIMLMFLMFLIFYKTLVMTMSQLFLKVLKHHKTIFIWKQPLIGVPLNTCSLKSSVKQFTFLVKFQALELKHFKK